MRAFTLIELMVAIAVLMTVTLVALPSYRTLSQNSRRTTASNDFVVALSYARAQAMEQHVSVSACRSSNATTTTPSCDSTGGTGWESGWVIFVDNNSNGVYESGDALLRQHEAINTGTATNPIITLRGTANVKNAITFTRYGMPANGGNLAICDSRGWGTNARYITLSAAGQVQSGVPGGSNPISSCTP